jgi:hypothetical protein
MAYVVSVTEKDQEKQNRSIRNAHERLTTAEADIDAAEDAIDAVEADIAGLATEVATNHVLFPATQVPSADPNALDDYEEGTWTPVLTFATPGDLAITYAAQSGAYTKIGRLVVLDFTVTTSAFTHTTASGNLTMTGAPFAAATQLFGGFFAFNGITKAGYTQFVAQIQSASTAMLFNASGSGVAESGVSAPDLPTGGTVRLRGSLIYRI